MMQRIGLVPSAVGKKAFGSQGRLLCERPKDSKAGSREASEGATAEIRWESWWPCSTCHSGKVGSGWIRIYFGGRVTGLAYRLNVGEGAHQRRE